MDATFEKIKRFPLGRTNSRRLKTLYGEHLLSKKRKVNEDGRMEKC